MTIYNYRNFLFNLLTDATPFGSLNGHLLEVTLIAIVVVLIIIKGRRVYNVFVLCIIQVVV
jgi:hypothetical protein